MKRLDRVQIGCLTNMQRQSAGAWFVGCGWGWQNSDRKTVLVMDGLASRGLVEIQGERNGERVYVITQKGLDALLETADGR